MKPIILVNRLCYFYFFVSLSFQLSSDESSEDLRFSSSLLDHLPHFSLNGLEEDEEDTLPLSGNDLSFFGHSPKVDNGQPQYQCHSCEQPDCSEESICNNAYQCWKSRVRDTTGTESVSKGCITNYDQQILYCSTLSFDNGQNNENGHGEYQEENSLYAIECCQGDFCNNGTFPPLPVTLYADDEGNAEYYETVLRLTLAVLCPVLILSIVLAVILLVMRKWHRQRMARLAIIEGSQGLDHTDYRDYRDELRVTAAGDSTLRVFIF